MKVLSGKELASYIQERQAYQVRALRQADKIFPKLAIVLTVDNPVINTYMRMKKRYGSDILIDVDIHQIDQKDAPAEIVELNSDETVHGIIVQLPLADMSQIDEIVNMVAPEKDVDALGSKALFEPATPMAVLWLLAGHNIELKGKKVLLVGRGKLVGAPLEKMLLTSGVDVTVADRQTKDLKAATLAADVIITATGSAGVITADMLKEKVVVVDAGTASEGGKTVGDLAEDVYGRDDITVTPQKGGVGPLTVCALFDNVIRAARAKTEVK